VIFAIRAAGQQKKASSESRLKHSLPDAVRVAAIPDTHTSQREKGACGVSTRSAIPSSAEGCLTRMAFLLSMPKFIEPQVASGELLLLKRAGRHNHRDVRGLWGSNPGTVPNSKISLTLLDLPAFSQAFVPTKRHFHVSRILEMSNVTPSVRLEPGKTANVA
jgi:hypothetical protein